MRNNIIIVLASIIGLSFVGMTGSAQELGHYDKDAALIFFNNKTNSLTDYKCDPSGTKAIVSLDKDDKIKVVNQLIFDKVVTYNKVNDKSGMYSFTKSTKPLDNQITIACAHKIKIALGENPGTCTQVTYPLCIKVDKANTAYDADKLAAQSVIAVTPKPVTKPVTTSNPNAGTGGLGSATGEINHENEHAGSINATGSNTAPPVKGVTGVTTPTVGTEQKEFLKTDEALTGIANQKTDEYPKIYPGSDGNYARMDKLPNGETSFKTFDKFGTQTNSNDQEVRKSIEDMPPGKAKDKAKSALAASKPPVEDAEAKKTKAQKSKETSEFIAAVNDKLTNYNSEKACVELPDAHFLTPCQEQIDNLALNIKTAINEYSTPKENCDSAAVSSDNFCSAVRNKTISDISEGLTASTTVIQSMAGASDVCKYTSKINLIGQSLFLASSLTCEGFRISCKLSCGNSEKTLATISKNLILIGKLTGLDPLYVGDVANFSTLITKEQADKVTPNQQTCKAHAADVKGMVAMAMGMVTAYTQAKACEKQLAAMDATSNGSGAIVSMAAMCAEPANASSTICKCQKDNTAVGCPGYIAGSGNEGNLLKTVSGSGASGMAGISYGSKVTPTSSSGLTTGLDGLGDEAKKSLAAGADPAKDAAMFSSAGASSAGGGGGGGPAGTAAGSDKGKIAEEPKSFGSSFMNAVSSMFKGGSGSGKAAAKDDKFTSDKYKEQIKRQIAAEQVRSEISSASGNDNWTKIRSRYKSNAGSLIDSN